MQRHPTAPMRNFNAAESAEYRGFGKVAARWRNIFPDRFSTERREIINNLSFPLTISQVETWFFLHKWNCCDLK